MLFLSEIHPVYFQAPPLILHNDVVKQRVHSRLPLYVRLRLHVLQPGLRVTADVVEIFDGSDVFLLLRVVIND
jgi:hypothetical protein